MNENKKNIKRRFLFSFAILLIDFSLFVGSTYAWFSNLSVVKGNKIFAGNLYVDIIASEDEMLNNLGFEESDLSNYKKYTKNYTDDTSENYYILTNEEAPLIKIFNMEPGQAHSVRFQVLNSGDLAIKYNVGFRLRREDENDETSHLQSYTGLETLEKQNDPSNTDFKIFHNKFMVNEGTINNTNRDFELTTTLDEEEYLMRKEKLMEMQWDEDAPDGQKDVGGHLEDILEVYFVDEDSYREDGSVNRNALSGTNYIGTVSEIIKVSDPHYVPVDDEESIKLETVSSRLRNTAIGYCLPKESITNSQGKTSKDGVSVNLYDDNVDSPDTFIEVKENIKDTGYIDFVLYMPENADSKYQYASLLLDIGVTASQVAFEYDGLNCMIYDRFERVEPEPDPTHAAKNIYLFYNINTTVLSNATATLHTSDATFNSSTNYPFNIPSGAMANDYIISPVTLENYEGGFTYYKLAPAAAPNQTYGIVYKGNNCRLEIQQIIRDNAYEFGELLNNYIIETGRGVPIDLEAENFKDEVWTRTADIFSVGGILNKSYRFDDYPTASVLLERYIQLCGSIYLLPGYSITNNDSLYIWQSLES